MADDDDDDLETEMLGVDDEGAKADLKTRVLPL